MTQKYTLQTVSDLKIKVQDLDGSLLNYYTQNQFLPDESFRLTKEVSDVPPIDIGIVNQMISALEIDDTEFEAGKILWEHLRLTPKQASDIGFWTYHNHHTFYPYIVKRWGDLWKPDKTIANRSNFILNHWVQSNSSQAGLIKYPISGLWWSFYLTLDNTRDDKFELTKVFFMNITLRVVQMGQTRFARYKPAIHGVLEFIKENKLDEKSSEEAARAIVPYINLLGGIRPLTYFDKAWFKEKLEKRFGAQIKAGEKLFIRAQEKQKVQLDKKPKDDNPAEIEKFDCYFCLDGESGNYKLSNAKEKDWSYCVGINFNAAQFLVHFYKEGKIKKSKVDGGLSNRRIDRVKLYANGKCPKLNVYSVEIINQPVLFGIAYRLNNKVFFKAMDEQNQEFFRTDNSDLHQEGKKVLYLEGDYQTTYKVLPYSLKPLLGTLVQGPGGRGGDLENSYYADRWEILKQYWPELFEFSKKCMNNKK